jgi:hypothetical protein
MLLPMLTAKELHLVHYFITECYNSKLNIIILIANIQLIFENEALLNIYWMYINQNLFTVRQRMGQFIQ